ncbi:TonB-dependent siderophore receptor [Salmonella enterica]|nr:TonB-dependent siderophore receptor [Salmonella enterica]EGM2345295.1 TonB-dependent siderophore receptor [Salmonella enterica]EGM2364011.1 TonB-dependent siderophore receptor [Salmonella enterica]
MRALSFYCNLLLIITGYSIPAFAEETMIVRGSGEYVSHLLDNAEKFPDPVKDTPRSIMVVPQKIIKDTNSASLIEALKYVPGISFKSGDALARPGGDHPVLRGSDATDAVTIDGVRNTASQSRESFDVDSVEVIKGPSSIYNGRGNAGGSINIVTKKPLIDYSFSKISFGLGSDNYKRITIDSNKSLSDRISSRINLMYHQNNKPKRSLVDYSRWGIAPSILVYFDNATSVLLSYYHLYTHDMPDYSTPFNKKTGRLLDSPRGVFYGQKNRDYIISHVDTPEIVFKHDFLNGATIKNTTLYSKTMQQFIATSPRISRQKNEEQFLFLQAKSGDFRTKTFSNLTDVSDEFVLGSMLHKISTGVEYTREENKRKSIFLTVDDPDSGKRWNIRSQDKNFSCRDQGLATYTCTAIGRWNAYNPWVGHKSWTQEEAYPATHTINNTFSGYLFDSINVTDNMIVSAGGRYDYFDTHTDVLQTSAPDINTHKGLFNYQLGVVYNPVESISFYSSWATSSNPANSNAIQGGIINKKKENFKPENYSSFELGAKWTPLSERMMFGIAWFDTKLKNGRFSVAPDESRAIGEQSIKGVEFNIAGDVTDNLSVFGGYSFLNTKITRSSKSEEIGHKVPFAPKQSATLWMDYNFTRKLSLGMGANYTGKTYTSTSNNTFVPGYTTVNAMAKYQFDNKTKMQLNINNILDRKYYDSLYSGFASFAPGLQMIFNVEYTF